MYKFCHVIIFIVAIYINSQTYGIDANQNRTLIIGIDTEYPPFSFIEKNEIVGFDIDIIKSISEEKKFSIKLFDTEFRSIFPSLLSNKIDMAISCFPETKERRKNFDFSKPYYITNVVAIFENNKKINSIEDLRNKRISTTLGALSETFILEELKKNNINIKHTIFNNSMQSIKAIENNSQDIAIMDKSIATVFKKQNKNLSYFKFPNTEIGCRILFKKNSQLINEINNAIDILIENKKMKQIEEKWFDKN